MTDFWKEWWEFFQIDWRAKFDDLISGGRASTPTTGVDTFPGGKTENVSKSQRQTGSCQYWIKGLPAPCRSWDGKNTTCLLTYKPPVLPPTGYGLGSCDQLGRRSWCDKYDPIDADNLEQFVCIAPCMEKSGLGKQIAGVNGFLSYRPLKISEIEGYNSDMTVSEVGQCDGWGMGRGKEGKGLDLLELLYDKLPICRQYRPFQMGFGAIQPRPFHGSDKPGKPFNSKVNYIPTTNAKLHDGSKADPLKQMEVILPFAFQIYNSRAMYQKCAFWENSVPSFFTIDYIGSDPSMFNIIMGDGTSYCKCIDSSCDPYKNIVSGWPKGLPWILLEVWAEYKGIVCNGAKPECPCYTGKWIYCTDNNMRDGMRITANQILELRFWTSNWSNQKEYDDFYLSKPGTNINDNSTASIYTFTKWDRLDPTEPDLSKMIGNMHSMCMPAPINFREFDPKTYVTVTPTDYPSLGTSLGTGVIGGKISFPTLLRELLTDFIPEICVIYPYYTIDPWSLLACGNNNVPDYCYHDSNLMEDPLISVIGNTVFNRKIYAISRSISNIDSTEIDKYIDQYKRAGAVPQKKWRECCIAIKEYITDVEKEGLAISYATSNKYGFFENSRVKLKLNADNVVYVICLWRTGDFTEYLFKKVKVKSRYWAGLIEQTAGIHNHGNEEVWFNFFPEFFYPGVDDVAGIVSTTIDKPDCSVQSIFSTYALYVYGINMDIAYYSYCINEYSKVDTNVIKWTQVGATGYIWAEIDDAEISYLWNFAVTEAFITNKKAKSSGIKTLFCGNTTTIPLEVIYPENILSIGISIDRNREIIRRALPPNAVLLKAPKPTAFFNSDWILTIRYTYQRMDTFIGDGKNSVVVWPYNMGTEWSYNKFAESPFKIKQNDEKFRVTEVGGIKTRGTMKIMAFLADSNNRIQAGVSTKLLLQGYNGGCRSVEINYKYLVDANEFNLEPNGGFFTWIGAPKIVTSSEPLVHGKYAKCGDHECSPSNCIGPVWFPFNNCTTFDYYDNVSNANYCMLPISEANPNISKMGKAGWRYVVADEFNAWISPGGNWAASCGSPWFYHYSHASGVQRFSGTAKKKAKVDAFYYIFMSWALPPFGNQGRGFIQRYVTRDFTSYLDRSGPIPMTRFCYMPMVFDKEDLFADLNPFANPDEATPLHEPFSHFSMMSNYTLTIIGENILKNRYRFDEIIEPIYHGNCMYPYPLMESIGGGWRTIRYGFKQANHVWAWPEFWKPIERNADSLNFVYLTKPEYYFDYNKVEHRLIINEGLHILIFTPPIIKDGVMTNYPSISIDGMFPRYFEILYTDYTPENVEWRDESEDGEVGASGGNGAIYEKANNGAGLNGLYTRTKGVQWLQDFNTLFDAESSADPQEDRKAFLGKSAVTGEDVYLYYNRGLIAFLPRNRLNYLPIEVKLLSITIQLNGKLDDENLNSIICYWDLMTYTFNAVPITIIITGKWGSHILPDKSIKIYSMPGINVIDDTVPITIFDVDNFPIWPDNSKVVDSIPPQSGKYCNSSTLESYELKFDLPRTPDRMIKNYAYCMAKIYAAYDSEFLNIISIDVEVGNYIRQVELINVFERRYYVSEANININADGPDTNLYRVSDDCNLNAGQYFPFQNKFTIVDHNDGTFLDEGVTDFEDGGEVVSKLNMVNFTKIFREDEVINVSMSNLKDVEANIQQDLYNEAFKLDKYDKLDFGGIKHPGVEQWLSSLNIVFSSTSNMSLCNQKIDWKHNNISRLLNQDGDFISPGGHFYKWGSKFTRQRCYIAGGVQNVYAAKYVHHKHGSGGEGSESDAMPTGAAYAGWTRLWYYNAKLGLLSELGQSESEMLTDMLTGSKNATPKRS